MNNHKLIMSLFENSVTFHKIMHHPRFEQPLFLLISKHQNIFPLSSSAHNWPRFTRVDFCFPAKISVFPPKNIFKFYRVHRIPLSCPLAVEHRTNFHRPTKLFWHRSCKLKRRKYPEFHFRRNGLWKALPQLNISSIFAHYLDITDLNNKIGFY